VHLGTGTAGPTITRIDLDVEGAVPGIDEAAFQQFADGAKKGCVVSRALAGVETITLNAKLADTVAG
jgi:osmotically inducible protein OsmC